MKRCYVDKEHRAIADLIDLFDGGMALTRINVPKASRGQGVATRLLKQITDDADREQVTLMLEIQPSGGLSFLQLRAWYVRNGFKRQGSGLYVRLPKASQESAMPKTGQRRRRKDQQSRPDETAPMWTPFVAPDDPTPIHVDTSVETSCPEVPASDYSSGSDGGSFDTGSGGESGGGGGGADF